MDIETRLHPRISANWYVFIKTLQGSVAIKTKDICVNGACILYPAHLELERRFTMFLKPPGAKSIRVIAEAVWSGQSNRDNLGVSQMGIRFLAISPEDQQFIANLLEKKK